MEREVLSVETLRERYIERTLTSKGLFKRTKKVIPGGITHVGRQIDPHTLFMKKGYGSKLQDFDGNEYIDYWIGHGALILGHARQEVIDAVKAQLDEGVFLGMPNMPEIELAEKVAKMVPGIDKVKFCITGTEATMHSLRYARAYTGRTKVAKVEGHFHGIHDSLFIGVNPPYKGPSCMGTPDNVASNTILLPFNKPEEAQRIIEKNAKELAAVILEPIKGGACIPSEPEYLKALREVTADEDIPLIFDEIVTGFRVAKDCAQGLYGITPDMTTLGKILGGGMPVSAFGGREDIMNMGAPKGPGMRDIAATFGTFSCLSGSMVSGITTLKLLEDGKVLEGIRKYGEKLKKGFDEAFKANGIPATITGVGSMQGLHFIDGREIKDMWDLEGEDKTRVSGFNYHLMNNGIFNRAMSFHSSAAHDDTDLEKSIAAAESFKG